MRDETVLNTPAVYPETATKTKSKRLYCKSCKGSKKYKSKSWNALTDKIRPKTNFSENWKLLRLKAAEMGRARKEAQGPSIRKDVSQRQKDAAAVGCVRCCGSAGFLSATIIAPRVPLCEKRGQCRGDTWDGCLLLTLQGKQQHPL